MLTVTTRHWVNIQHIKTVTDAMLLVKVQKMADMSTTKRTPGAPPPLEFPPFLYGKLILPGLNVAN